MGDAERDDERRSRLAFWSWQDRQLRSTDPPRLENGRRLIRVRPEWAIGLPLWESFTEVHQVAREALPISPELQDALVAWNESWQDRAHDADLRTPQRWIAEGHELVDRLREELRDIAEIRAEFDL
ncbi:hypothetical protein [Microbacterium sp. VKM Ac-2923]|uniref:hypothetical protein n=1 Tax=Microbacterium sp. VKM Ac-2923 TaxID=2929476 RepID=UPI001FB4E49E|nr:hypothetical protein [Microbacterium sp. VKM Ac-2923]MCJ1706086.1 hypothetical protein [Microbacterium sp. VKM Ac-2923]